MRHRIVAPVALIVLGGLTLAAAASAGVHVAVTPALVQVALNQEFTLELTVTEPDGAFNAFDAVVEFDPLVLAFLPESPTALQEGALMTGACGSTFHRFAAEGDSLTITEALLCAATSLTGPGQVYRLRFRAGANPGTTFVRLRAPRVKFYNAGLYVLPVSTADASIQVGDVTGAGEPRVARRPSLRARPNPAFSGTTLRISAPGSGLQQVSIYDVRGRMVRAFEATEQPAGDRDLVWDRRDQAGQRVGAGLYSIVLRAGTARATARVTFVQD